MREFSPTRFVGIFEQNETYFSDQIIGYKIIFLNKKKTVRMNTKCKRLQVCFPATET